LDDSETAADGPTILVPDASSIEDSANEASQKRDASATWCQLANPLFCSDFDQSPFDDVWTARSVVEGAVEAAPTRFRSEPAGFHSVIPLRVAAARAEGRLLKVFPQSASVAKLGFDLFIDPFELDDAGSIPTGGMDFVAIDRGASVASLHIDHGYTMPVLSSLRIVRPNGASDYAAAKPLDLGRWVHVDMTVTYADAPNMQGAIELRFDGEVVQSLGGETTLYPPVSASISLCVGVLGARAGPGVSATYDNVTLDLIP
jgi:hypothetical protein